MQALSRTGSHFPLLADTPLQTICCRQAEGIDSARELPALVQPFQESIRN